ncbi:hypothetical protein GCM10027596_35170 [Nocardioides korecus]
MTELTRVAVAARVFTLATLTSLAALAGPDYLVGALALLVVALTALLLSWRTPWPQWTIAVVEGFAVAVVAGVGHPHEATVVPYLVIPALLGSLDLGWPGLVRVVVPEFLTLLAVWVAMPQTIDRAMASNALTWLATAVGLGLLGLRARRPAAPAPDSEGSYRSAVGLIRRLEALSGRLTGGLDPVSIAERVMTEAAETVPTRAAGVFVRSPSGAMVPVRYSAGTQAGAMTWAEELSARCWEYDAMMLREHRTAIPLSANDEMIAVLVLESLTPVDTSVAVDLRRRLGLHAVQLQAALLFGRVRDAATSQERQRIAREVHDGIAQDVASLGYLVDNLAAGAHDPVLEQQLGVLRSELTRIVTELRHSIFDLRHEIDAGAGLGESLSAYANQVSATSSMAVHVTLDEDGPRLPGDVELELLRIAQEAMANARKHARADNLWLRCTVRSPYAEIEVCDDGTRPHDPRPDSQGLAIMRERARSVGADLLVEAPEPSAPGTRVLVRVGSSPR